MFARTNGFWIGVLQSGLIWVLLVGCSRTPVRFESVTTSQPEGVAPAPAMTSTVPEDPLFLPGVRVVPKSVEDGGILRLELAVSRGFASSGPVVVTGEFRGNSFLFFPEPDSGNGDLIRFGALLGIPFGTATGKLVVPVTVRRPDQESLRYEASVLIVKGDYPSETLSVDSRHVSPDRQAAARIRREQAEVGKLYRRSVRERLWDGQFQLPISSAFTSVYGVRRVYNGKMQSFHQGLDLKAAEGTPVLAAGAGRVVLAKDLYLTGNTVIVDHGYDVFTIYAHLSALNVSAGKLIPRGFLLGLSGKTGRVSGPHLHWGANLQKARVNPIGLIRLTK